jgi:hypothetical protein
MVRLCWVLAVVCACSSGNARRPVGPPPVYEPRPLVGYTPPTATEADPVDALLDAPGPGATSDAEPTPSQTPPVEAAPNPHSTGATPTTTNPTPAAATVSAPVNSKP